ncbi:MAG: FtsQ-type POTRA domain-containing protein, partial [Gammaproteobacteria bacterium]|nr:FtsQ-type POTRA domain-containing protein [Gammaproteobacteria bacterium]
MARVRKQGKQAKRNTPATASKSFRWRKSYNWLFLLLPLAVGGIYLGQVEQLLPIRTIQLSGAFKNLDQEEVESTLQQYLGQGFFSFDIHHLQQTLHDNSWTQLVSVRRIWPDKLGITIEEKKPVARWD